MNENNERYSYSFQPTEEITVSEPVKKKKNRFGIQLAAIAIACTLLGTSGGVLGAMFVLNTATDPAQQQVQEAAPPQTAGVFGTLEASQSDGLGMSVTANTTTLTLREIYAKSNPAVVSIVTETTGRNAFGQSVNLPSSGSGFVISADGYIVTNNHVISGATSISIQMSDEETYTAEVIGADSYTDLAVLKIDAKNLDYLSFGDSNGVYVGDMVAAIGNPLGELANTFTVGYISALHREINIDGIPRTMLQTDAAVNSGNSGGPLINEYGLVIGVVAAKSSGSGVEGLGFAIPSNLAGEVVNQLIEHGYVTNRPYIGVNLTNRVYGYNQSVLQVESVIADSPAEKSGLNQGDYILEANGENISTREELLGVLYGQKIGDKMTLKIQRNGEALTLEVILGEYKN